MPGGGKRLAPYLAAAPVFFVFASAYVFASSTVTIGPAQATTSTKQNPPAFSTASLNSSALTVQTTLTLAYSTLGVQSGATGGVAGTTTTLQTCASGPCSENHRPASQTFAASLGDIADQVVLTVTQPTGPTPTGFDVVIRIGFGISSLATATVYVSTGVTSAATPQTVNVAVLVDLGTASTPVVNGVSAAFNPCSGASVCP